MDKTVKEKVSAAVQNKLRKILGSVDNELHEYIMVMIANRKTRTKLEDRLKPFLGEDSDMFALWLIKLLDDYKCYNHRISSKSENKYVIKKESEDNRLDVLVLNPQSHEVIELLSKDDLQCPLEPDEIPEVISKRVSKEVHREVSKKVFKEVHREVPEKTSKEVFKEVPVSYENPTKKNKLSVSVEQYTNSQIYSGKKLKVHESETLKNHSTSKVGFSRGDTKQQKLSDSSSSQATNSGEYDPLYPSFDDWHGPSKRKLSISANSQTSKLSFRAMDDANASILREKTPAPVYQPTPIKILARDRENGRNIGKRGHNYKVRDEFETTDCNSIWSDKNKAKHQLYLPCSSRIESNMAINEENAVQLLEVSTSESTEVVEDLVSITDKGSDGTNDQEHQSLVTSPQSNLKLGSYLDTVKKLYSHTLCNKPLSEDLDMQDLFVLNNKTYQPQQALEDITSKKQKSVERCPSWPGCKNNETCDYRHPSVSCKAFPNCKFLDKCLYVHPFCKFDSSCTRKNCPYTHVSKQDLSQTNSRFQTQPRSVKKPSLVIPQLCKFYPNCTAYHCSFLHPNKKCHFGSNCKTPNCPFLHQNFPSQGKFKWVASSS